MRIQLIACFVAISTAACSTAPSVTDSGCKSFRPIAGSKADTVDTKRQVIGHNRAYDAICPQQKTTS